MTRALTLFAASLLLAACGSTPRESYYTLSASPAPAPAAGASPVSVTIGPVVVPEAVDRSPMVVRTGPNEVSIDDLHRWVEPLKSAIPRAMAASEPSARPPSENESGVTLSTPMTQVLSPRITCRPPRVSRYGRLGPRASIAPPPPTRA